MPRGYGGRYCKSGDGRVAGEEEGVPQGYGGRLTRLIRMVVEYTRLSVKTKSSTYQFMINQFN